MFRIQILNKDKTVRKTSYFLSPGIDPKGLLVEIENRIELDPNFSKLSSADAKGKLVESILESMFRGLMIEVQNSFLEISKIKQDSLKTFLSSLAAADCLVQKENTEKLFKKIETSLNKLISTPDNFRRSKKFSMGSLVEAINLILSMYPKELRKRKSNDLYKNLKRRFYFTVLLFEPAFVLKCDEEHMLGSDNYMEFLKSNFFKNRKIDSLLRGKNSKSAANIASIRDTIRRFRKEAEHNQISFYERVMES